MDTKLEVLADTIRHVSEVAENLAEMRHDLEKRGIAHDRSKFEAVEFDAFVETRPAFKKANFGTPEYQKCTEATEEAVNHHYANNRHHTDYHSGGFADMNLLDILEMLADWRAASRRSPDLSFEESLPRAFERYKIPGNMQKHIVNTLKYLRWI